MKHDVAVVVPTLCRDSLIRAVHSVYRQNYSGSIQVLVGVDFELRSGEVAIITGPAAAGKTTFTHLLRLALTPRAGRAVILGVDPARATGSMRARAIRRTQCQPFSARRAAPIGRPGSHRGDVP